MAQLTRRQFTGGIAATALTAQAFGIRSALAQSYPAQDLRFVCAFAAGTGADIIVRHFAEKIRPLAGRAIIVENKPGALGNIATEYVARSKPDGYTIYVTGASAVAANMHLLKDPIIDVTQALQVAATIHQTAMTLVVRADAPSKSLAELTTAMKQKGDKANYAITNPAAKVLGAMYREQAGLQAVEVSYKAGNDYLNDLYSGHIDYAIADNVQALALSRAGKLRILAVGSTQRLQSAAEFPTLTELGYPMDIKIWMAALVPSATPRPIIEQVNRWFAEALAAEDTKKFLANIGSDPWISTPEEGQAFLVRQVKDWGDYVRLANIEKQ
jgi:tripartite-type tricarboxylate transporter receptor subunit TctC